MKPKTPIRLLPVSTRVYNLLVKGGFKTVEELREAAEHMTKPPARLLYIDGLGCKGNTEIVAVLKSWKAPPCA